MTGMRKVQLAGPSVVLALLMLGSCVAEAPDRADEEPPAGNPERPREPASEGLQDRVPEGVGTWAPSVDSAHVQAARRIVAFLRGETELEPALLGDRVELRLAPEGGGDRRVVERTRLGSRANWRIADYELIPPDQATELTLRPGQHMRCFETDLATVAPDLAQLPHVGAKLDPPAAESCLQSWNLTLVFAADAAGPEVVAVVYDQWEW